jgi:hypothetical protein
MRNAPRERAELTELRLRSRPASHQVDDPREAGRAYLPSGETGTRA